MTVAASCSTADLVEERPNSRGVLRFWVVGQAAKSYATRRSAEQAARALSTEQIEDAEEAVRDVKSSAEPPLRYIAFFMIDGNAMMASPSLEGLAEATRQHCSLPDTDFIEIRDYGDRAQSVWSRSHSVPGGIGGGRDYTVVMRGSGYAPRLPAI